MSIAVVYLTEEYLDVSLITSVADKDLPVYTFRSMPDAKKSAIPSGYIVGCCLLKDGCHIFSDALGLDFFIPGSEPVPDAGFADFIQLAMGSASDAGFYQI